ncbi:MAG TPA: pepsin-like aspartic protease [Rhizomicrobium sp.]|jgi:hypothetical protein
MAKIARVPITNVYADGDYTGCLLVGPKHKPMNLLLDSGSSTLALNRDRYRPHLEKGGDKTTNLVQAAQYGDGSGFTGAVIETTVRAGIGRSTITVRGANAAMAYHQTSDMFGKCDGILGLAYAGLDDAYAMPKDTWHTRYRRDQFYKKKLREYIPPYLTQMAQQGVVSDRFAFYTQRSFIHLGGGVAKDPLNQGWLILGGGEECKDLYTGRFQTARVMSEDYYDTNLTTVIVGKTDPIVVTQKLGKNAEANSIVDSGTQTLDIAPHLLRAVLSKFPHALKEQLSIAIYENRLVHAGDLNLDIWPDITFILEGETKPVKITVSPRDYWQVNAQHVGQAVAAITKGDPGQTILGLPAMNGYFTLFDGEAAGGLGTIKFAPSKRPG